MARLKRRTLLKLGVVGGGLLGVSGGLAWVGRDRIRTLSPNELAGYLQGNFSYLNFNFGEGQFLEYAKQYRKHYNEIKRKSWYLFRGGDADTYQRVIDHFATTFLMSTDFFLQGADEAKQINYVMMYHPYHSPCWNPISMS